jgi:hypothetical protein
MLEGKQGQGVSTTYVLEDGDVEVGDGGHVQVVLATQLQVQEVGVVERLGVEVGDGVRDEALAVGAHPPDLVAVVVGGGGGAVVVNGGTSEALAARRAQA